MSKNQLVQVLTRAKTEVQHGWIQNTQEKLVFGRKTVCAHRALSYGMANQPAWDWDHDLWQRAQKVFLQAADELFPTQHKWVLIEQWNDEPGRTKAEVLETFDRALKIAERDG